jgi:hypothetical protein
VVSPAECFTPDTRLPGLPAKLKTVRLCRYEYQYLYTSTTTNAYGLDVLTVVGKKAGYNIYNFT